MVSGCSLLSRAQHELVADVCMRKWAAAGSVLHSWCSARTDSELPELSLETRPSTCSSSSGKFLAEMGIGAGQHRAVLGVALAHGVWR